MDALPCLLRCIARVPCMKRIHRPGVRAPRPLSSPPAFARPPVWVIFDCRDVTTWVADVALPCRMPVRSHARLMMLATVTVAGVASVRLGGAPQVGTSGRLPTSLTASAQRWPGAELGKGVVLSDFAPRYTVYSLKFTAGRPIELHDQDTDIVFIQGGSGIVVHGGTVVGRKALKDGEWTGTDIDGGITTPVTRGMVLLLPKGVPHWFKSVNGSLTFYAVKVSEPGAPGDQTAARIWTRADAFAAKTPTIYNGGDAHHYQLFAVSRNEAGIPEVHEKEIDLVFVLDGDGTWMIGGSPAANKTTAGGAALHVGPDDGIMVPPRVHHWFSQAKGLSYYAMKVY